MLRKSSFKGTNMHIEEAPTIHDATRQGFATRSESGISEVVFGYRRSQVQSLPAITDCSSVTLHHADHDVHIDQFVVQADGVFTGTISEFRPGNSEYRGMKIGDSIRFREQHVFAGIV